MRNLILVLALVLAVYQAGGQPFVRDVYLPDSLGGVSLPELLAYSSQDNRLYIGARYGKALVAVDGATNSRIARIPLGFAPIAMCHDPTTDNVYVAGRDTTGVAVLDGSSGGVVARLEVEGEALLVGVAPSYCRAYFVGEEFVTIVDTRTNAIVRSIAVEIEEPAAFSVSDLYGKCYVADESHGTALAFDLAGDSLLATVAVGRGPAALELDPLRQWLYCADGVDSTVTVIDCRTDSVIRTAPVNREPFRLAVNARMGKTYVAHRSDEFLTVLSDSSTAVIETPGYPVAVSCDAVRNRLYCLTGRGYLLFIDCTSDEIVEMAEVAESEDARMAFAGRAGKLYCVDGLAGSDRLSVVDIVGETLMVEVTLGDAHPRTLAVCPVERKVYCGASGSAAVYALDFVTGAALNRIPVGGQPAAMHYSSIDNRLYCASTSAGAVTVVDCAGDSITALIPTGGQPTGLCSDQSRNKVYCSDAFGSVIVIDGYRGTILRTIAVDNGPGSIVHHSPTDRVFCAVTGGNTVTVIASATDSIVKSLYVGNGPRKLISVPRHNKLYCTMALGVRAIAGDGLSAGAYVGYTLSPVDLVYNPQLDRIVFVTDGDDGRLVVIDPSTDSVVSNVPFANRSARLACDATTGYVYAIDQRESGRLKVFDLARSQLVSTIPVGAYPVTLVAHSGRVFVGNNADCSISLVSGVTGLQSQPVSQLDRETRTLWVAGRISPNVLLGELYDRTGSRVASGALGRGLLAPGVYFVRLPPGAAPVKLIVVR